MVIGVNLQLAARDSNRDVEFHFQSASIGRIYVDSLVENCLKVVRNFRRGQIQNQGDGGDRQNGPVQRVDTKLIGHRAVGVALFDFVRPGTYTAAAAAAAAAHHGDDDLAFIYTGMDGLRWIDT
jgi:hypothetical protein